MSASQQAEPGPGRRTRDLMRARPTVAIGTSLAGQAQGPYVSLAIVAAGHDAAPLLLLSRLAEHTRNLEADPRISLLFDGTTGLASPLTGARASVQGKACRVDDPLLLERFIRRHPDAALYAGFTDFSLFRIDVARAHLVAGFGKIHWIDGPDILFDLTGYAGLATAEADIVAHMNEDHAEAVQLYARLAGSGGTGWIMTGVDPEGADLRRGGEILRIPFETPARDASDARTELVRLARTARETAHRTTGGVDHQGPQSST